LRMVRIVAGFTRRVKCQGIRSAVAKMPPGRIGPGTMKICRNLRLTAAE